MNQTKLKVVSKFALLGFALGFLIILPYTGTAPVQAQEPEREMSTESTYVPVLHEPETSLHHDQRIPLSSNIPIYLQHDPSNGQLTFVIDWILFAAIATIIAALVAIGLLLWAVSQWVRARITQNKWKFLTKYTDEQTRRYARALNTFIMGEIAQCDAYDRNDVEVTSSGIIVVTNVNYELYVVNDDSGRYYCQDTRTGTKAFMRDLDDWVQEN